MALILKLEIYGVDMTGSDYYGVIDSIDYNKDHKNCL